MIIVIYHDDDVYLKFNLKFRYANFGLWILC